MGYRVVDLLGARHQLPDWERHGLRLEAAGEIVGQPVLLVKPLTFMNRSGWALAELHRQSPFDLDELLVCYDELALPLGRLRLRPEGSDGGHNGLASLIESLGSTEFVRLRVGIAPDDREVEDASSFVLGSFRAQEQALIDEAVEHAADAIECVLSQGVTAAMNRYNPEQQ